MGNVRRWKQNLRGRKFYNITVDSYMHRSLDAIGKSFGPGHWSSMDVAGSLDMRFHIPQLLMMGLLHRIRCIPGGLGCMTCRLRLKCMMSSKPCLLKGRVRYYLTELGKKALDALNKVRPTYFIPQDYNSTSIVDGWRSFYLARARNANRYAMACHWDVKHLDVYQSWAKREDPMDPGVEYLSRPSRSRTSIRQKVRVRISPVEHWITHNIPESDALDRVHESI